VDKIFKEAVMKKFLVLLVLFVAGMWATNLYAEDAKAALAVVKAEDVKLLADTSGVPNDTVITWQALVVDKGLKEGDEGYLEANKLCTAYDKAFAEAYALKDAGKLLDAAKKVPLSWVKSCYLYNFAASLVAEKNSEGLWAYTAELVKKDGDKAIKYFNMAKTYSDKAVKAGIVGKGKDAPEKVNERIANGLKAIDDLKNPRPVKKSKKKAAEDTATDE
jgi:hypothetical protein